MEKSRFLSNLKTNKESKRELDEFKNEIYKYREFTKDDSYKIGFVGVWFETKGKGEWEVLQKIHHCCIDTGKIGDVWGECYIYSGKTYYEPDELHMPKRFKIKSHRILIKDWDGK